MRFIFRIFFLLFVIGSISAQTNSFNAFSLRSLQSYSYRTSSINIRTLAFKNDLQYAYNVTYTSMNLTVSARLSVPATTPENIKGIVIMLRGHQNRTGYYTGKGTENPARGYLERGWAVIAPDFLSFGSSSPTPAPFDLHQFYSTINAVELYKSLEAPDFRFAAEIAQANRAVLPRTFRKIVLWGHSNGGQVALHFLTIIQRPVPTVLWAPVSLPFPDSAAHYGRNPGWAQLFREQYNVNDFSYLAHLDKIAPGTPILLEQGDRDTGVPKSWNDALARAIGEENTRREQLGIGKIDLRYEIYTGANHNLNPYWSTVLPRDAAFWERER